jgi:hypothetical protein
MAFADRAALSEAVAGIVNRYLFAKAPFLVQHFGVEKHLSPDALRALCDSWDAAANFARYAPDYLVVHRPSRTSFFVEYKTMLRRASRGMIRERATNEYARLSEEDWQRVRTELVPETWGVVERDALDQYLLLDRAGIRVCVIAAVSYHPELLLADWAHRLVVVYRQPQHIQARPGRRANLYSAGSVTPNASVHLGRMRKLSQFLEEEFAFDVGARLKRVWSEVWQCLAGGRPRG